MTTGPAELRTLAEKVARAAAELVSRRMGTVMAMETKSSPVDIVTEVDQAAEHLLVEMILAERPDDSIVGEEGTGIEGTSGFTWVLDPIDGTTNFVYNYPGFGVSVAVRKGNTTVAGAVVDIMHHTPGTGPESTPEPSGDMYSAALTLGATRNGVAIKCSTLTTMDTALVATGFSFDAKRRGHQAHALTRILPRVRDIRRQGSAAIDLCSVAAGRVDAYFEYGLNDWDLAAGSLIASEAGAKVTVTPVENGQAFLVASAPGLEPELSTMLENVGATDV